MVVKANDLRTMDSAISNLRPKSKKTKEHNGFVWFKALGLCAAVAAVVAVVLLLLLLLIVHGLFLVCPNIADLCPTFCVW